MSLERRVDRLEQQRPETRPWLRMISPRADMTVAECDAFKAAELVRLGLPADTPVILRRIFTVEGVAAARGGEVAR